VILVEDEGRWSLSYYAKLVRKVVACRAGASTRMTAAGPDSHFIDNDVVGEDARRESHE